MSSIHRGKGGAGSMVHGRLGGFWHALGIFFIFKNYTNALEKNDKNEKTKGWPNLSDPDWQVVATAFKSYTPEAAMKLLKQEGYVISKSPVQKITAKDNLLKTLTVTR